VSEQTQGSTGKGRPTPKRSEAQRRRGPVAPPPTNRREAAKQLRAQQADNRKRMREGSLRGDESAMLKRDQGPVRRLVRDVVDGRRTLGWILMPIAVVVVAAGLFNNVQLQALTFAVWLASFAAVAIDMVFVSIDIRKAVRTAFPSESTRGHIAYGLLRTTVIRRWRVPRPRLHP
jgi:hypothetical protein